MIEIGKKQKLLVVKTVEFGVYLAENKEADAKSRVLLPVKQVPQGTKEGDCLEVFIYKDSQDRLIATTRGTCAYSRSDCCSEGAPGNKNRRFS